MTNQLEVLLVEDNPADAELTICALKQRHLADNLVHVWDGQAALDFLFGTGAHAGRDSKQQPKVVLLDLKLPKVDGISVLRQLRADERTKATPVVVLTSSREDRDVIESYNLGVNSYIVKPVTFEAIVDTLQTLEKHWFQIVELPSEDA